MDRHEKLKLAMRILNCAVSRQCPDPMDVRLLKSVSPEPQSNWPADELATYTIQSMVRRFRVQRAGD